MPRGQPDYGLYTQTPVASGIADPGEAVARLGGINIYDRRGWTVWMDDFEAPVLKWLPSSNVGGTDPVLSTAQAWMGIQSVYFTTAAAGATFAQIQRDFPLVRRGRIGLEFFTHLNVATPSYLTIILYIWDGTNRSDAELRLDNVARTATIVTPDGEVPVATTCFPEPDVYPFIPVKLVVDMDTDRYVRLLIGPDEIDLPHSLVLPGVPSDDRFLRMYISLVGDVAGISEAYVDNFILTQNEP